MTQQNFSKVMSFYEHFDELRARLMRALAVFFVGFVICYFFADFFLAILRKPLFDAIPPDQQKLYFTHLFENFMMHLRIAAYASVFLFSPYFFYEFWSFISPGLKPEERRMALPFIVMATLFFIGGRLLRTSSYFP